MASEIDCPGCGFRNVWNGEIELKCAKCGEVISSVQSLLEGDISDRFGIAAGYRRVGRFDDSLQEYENLLERYGNLPEALFCCFLNSYEITEYAFDKTNNVRICKCNSTSKRPVEKNRDLQDARKLSKGMQLEQWTALSDKIEKLRLQNIRIKNNLPKYRAILICDYDDEKAIDTARAIYEILSSKTDIFFPPVTLQDIKFEDKERYLIQAIKNPEIAPLMFVVYSDAFNYRNKAKHYFSNIAGQCREFAKVHTKAELFSVTCDYEPSPMMKTISIKTIRCKEFDSKYYNSLANKILENILISAYDDDEYERYEEGEIIKLNADKGLSPKVRPLEDE